MTHRLKVINSSSLSAEQNRQKKLAMERHMERIAKRKQMTEEEKDRETKAKMDALFNEDCIRVSSENKLVISRRRKLEATVQVFFF